MSNISFELSPLYRHTSSHTAFFPPEEPLVVTCHLDRIILRNTQTLAIQQTWQLPIGPPSTSTSAPRSARDTKPTQSETATPPPKAGAGPKLPPPESLLTSLAVSSVAPYRILAFSAKVGTGWILDREYDEPVGKVEIGGEGAVGMCWSGLGDTVMVWSASHLRISLYRLSNPTPALHILSPKLAYPQGFAFRPGDSRYLAVAERHSGKDHIGVYDSATWKLLRHFALPLPTSDIADLAWSPCGRYIAAWEAVTDYILHIYTPDGRLLTTFAPYANLASTPATSTPNPTALSGSNNASQARAREERSTEGWVGLGIRTVRWHPTGDWLAVGGWDGRVRVLTRLSWAPVAELTCTSKVVEPASVWREPVEWIERTRGRGIVGFDPCPLPHQSTSVRPDMARPSPKMGIADLAWSPSGRWLAAYNPSLPTQIFIFSFLTAPLSAFHPRLHSVIILTNAFRSFTWQPEAARAAEMLVIVSGTKGFAMWREPDEGAAAKVEGVGIPSHAAFGPTAVKFAPAGDAVLLQDREMFAVAYPVGQADQADEADEGEGGRTWIGGDDD